MCALDHIIHLANKGIIANKHFTFKKGYFKSVRKTFQTLLTEHPDSY